MCRYREKRKRRTFEKTIRYESRKAYAEVRPRIKVSERAGLECSRMSVTSVEVLISSRMLLIL